MGTGLLAVPVLAGSAAYGIGEAFRWRTGLDRAPVEARAFYGATAAATGAGVLLNFAPVDPMEALFWSASPEAFTIGRTLTILGWLSTGVTRVDM